MLQYLAIFIIMFTIFAPPVIAQVEVGPAQPAITDRNPEHPAPQDINVPGASTQIEGTSPVSPVNQCNVNITTPSTITEIGFRGNSVIAAKDLVDITGLQAGGLLTEANTRKAIDNIIAAYGERGYIVTIADIDLPQPGASGPVIFTLEEVKVGAVRFEGLHRVKEYAIRRMLEVQAGQIYNRNAVTRDLIRLQELQVFESVTPVLSPVEFGRVILTWRVVEREKLNYVEIGGDYSPQDGVTGTAQLTFGNFRGRSEKLNLLATVSSINGEFGGQVNYYLPWIAPHNTAASFYVYSLPVYRFSENIPTESDRYFERHSGFRTYVSRRLSTNQIGAAGLRLENINVSNFPQDVFVNNTIQDGSVYLANFRSIWDHRNSAIDPTSGMYSVAFVEGGISKLDVGGTSGIVKTWGDQRWYLPLRRVATEGCGLTDPNQGPVPIIALRGLLAGSTGDLPFYEQFFVGGISDLPLRGYIEDRFWGKYAFLASAELRWPFGRKFSGAAFVDAGDAWGSDFQFRSGVFDSDFNQDEHFTLHAGAGVGVRYASSFGPIRLDFAYGDKFRTYFSVGQVF